MEIIPALIPFLTLAIGIGLPVLLLIQILNKKSVLLKIPSLQIWKILVKKLGSPPKTKLNIFNISFLVQLILLCLLAYLCSSPILLQKSKHRPVINILINRSTSMSTKSELYATRWDQLKKTLNNQLLDNGLRSDDLVNLYFNPPVNTVQKEVSLTKIDKIINETSLVDFSPNESIFYQLAKEEMPNIYVTDSIAEIPDSVKEKFSIIYIKDNTHINVGWVEFWVENQTVNGVLKNFSDYSLNVNIDLKINGVSIQANDFAPAIKPKESFLYRKEIQDDLNSANLIELSVDCPGDALESDNLVSLSRMQAQKLKVIVDNDVPPAIIKAARAMGDKIDLTMSDIPFQIKDGQFDLLISNKFNNLLKINQLIVGASESNSLFQVLNESRNGYSNTTQWLSMNEQKLLENVMFEGVLEIKENALANKLLVESQNSWPLILRWKNEKKVVYLLNFDCSEKATLPRTPLFPFLIAKVIDEMNFNSFHYFKTGQVIEEYNISSNQTKVFQSNRKGSAASINFNNSDLALLANSGIFSNENINICVNLLNSKESDVKQVSHASQAFIDFATTDSQAPIDLRPYIAGIIFLIVILEWVYSKKESYA